MGLHNNENIIFGRDFSARVVPLLNAAKSSIKIVVFDWRVYLDGAKELTDFNTAVFRAVQRGVNVQAVVNSKSILETLKKAGVRAKHFRGTGLLHAKFIIIDEKLLIIGSHNFTQNALTTNLEISVICEIEYRGSRLASFFQNLYGV